MDTTDMPGIESVLIFRVNMMEGLYIYLWEELMMWMKLL